MPTFRVVFEADVLFEAATEEETDKDIIFRDERGRIVKRFAKGIICAHWIESQFSKDGLAEEEAS